MITTRHLLKQGDDSGQPPGNGIERIEENNFLKVHAAGNDPFCIKSTLQESFSEGVADNLMSPGLDGTDRPERHKHTRERQDARPRPIAPVTAGMPGTLKAQGVSQEPTPLACNSGC